MLDRGGVDAHLVRAGPERQPDILRAPDPAAHGERHEEPLRGVADQVERGGAGLGTRANIEEDDLVGAFRLIAGREVRRVALVAEIDEPGSLHHPPAQHVEADDQPFGNHFPTRTAPLVDAVSATGTSACASARPSALKPASTM